MPPRGQGERRAARAAGIVLAVFGGLLLAPAHVAACTCTPGSLTGGLGAGTAVFVGKVTDIWDPNGLPYVFFAVDYSWKRVSGDRATVRASLNEAACGFPFAVGGRYLVYASAYGDELRTGLCSPTKPLALASEDLAELGEPAPTPPPSPPPEDNPPRFFPP